MDSTIDTLVRFVPENYRRTKVMGGNLKTRLEFAHAILERRLTDGFINVEYKKPNPFGQPPGANTTSIVEPLHDKSAVRVVEAVENIARAIVHTAERKRMKIVCSELTITSADVRLTVYEFEEIE